MKNLLSVWYDMILRFAALHGGYYILEWSIWQVPKGPRMFRISSLGIITALFLQQEAYLVQLVLFTKTWGEASSYEAQGLQSLKDQEQSVSYWSLFLTNQPLAEGTEKMLPADELLEGKLSPKGSQMSKARHSGFLN